VTELTELQAKADEKRARLGRTLRNLEKRATLLGLADDIIARAGGAPRSSEIGEALRRNPILAVGVALCAGLLIVEVNKVRKSRMLNDRGRPRAHHASLSATDQTEESHHAS
jgi:hypothetical protein